MDKEYLETILELSTSTILAWEEKRERVLEKLSNYENEE